MFARSPTIDGHTTVVDASRTSTVADAGRVGLWQRSPGAARCVVTSGATYSLFTDNEGGGNRAQHTVRGTTLYSHLNVCLRSDVVKVQNGHWFNTWMNADEASWINDTNYDAIAPGPQFGGFLLGSSRSAMQRDQLLGVIAEKRTYLQDHPSSCRAAPIARTRLRRCTR